ncbi:hypothetical protein CR164_09610 [Prosthecochloris marina]|uniref:Uncharacterized protein n=1 Tax=Prosthecochloris marina TaxID=2017681 RepID=A0A317T4S7_9CHLB|nr:MULTISPECIES: hypothetical protein [Prosthecochloris]PWW81653.1 hypothetical protein CR164_09610 [Prosthecochloris marina]UZJ40079.1 hypothetical protein OO185_02970 [Prosthecochloris sp. SCSIO W1102]
MFPGNTSDSDKSGRKRFAEVDVLKDMLNEKDRQIRLLHQKLKQSDEYGRNLSDLLRELVRLLAIIEQ